MSTTAHTKPHDKAAELRIDLAGEAGRLLDAHAILVTMRAHVSQLEESAGLEPAEALILDRLCRMAAERISHIAERVYIASEQETERGGA